ncbi:MAG: DUF5305 family protein [Proteocatella sp.]
MKSQNRKIIRFALIILGAAITSAGIFFLTLEFRSAGTVEQEIPIAAYTSQTGVNYSVLPKANMIYSEDVLKEDLTYITEFVNQVNTDFEYKVSGDSSMKVNGNYQVNVQFSGYTDGEDSKATVWSKVKTLVPKTDFLLNATGDVLSQKVRINLGDYIGFTKTVIEASNIKVPVNATVTMSGEATVNNSKGEAVEPILASIVIPLDKAYFNIEKQVAEAKEGSIKIKEEVRAPLNMMNMIIRGFTVLIGIGIILMGIRLKPLTEEEKKAKLIKKILSSYGSRSVGVSEIPTDKIDDRYEIKLIEDIVKVADELGKPILYEYKDNIADIDFFCVVDGNSMYRYMLQTI